MTDNERSRADELFDILNEFSDDKNASEQSNMQPPIDEQPSIEPIAASENIVEAPIAAESTPESSGPTPISESESHVDEILEILNRGTYYLYRLLFLTVFLEAL